MEWKCKFYSHKNDEYTSITGENKRNKYLNIIFIPLIGIIAPMSIIIACLNLLISFLAVKVGNKYILFGLTSLIVYLMLAVLEFITIDKYLKGQRTFLRLAITMVLIFIILSCQIIDFCIMFNTLGFHRF